MEIITTGKIQFVSPDNHEYTFSGKDKQNLLNYNRFIGQKVLSEIYPWIWKARKGVLFRSHIINFLKPAVYLLVKEILPTQPKIDLMFIEIALSCIMIYWQDCQDYWYLEKVMSSFLMRIIHNLIREKFPYYT